MARPRWARAPLALGAALQLGWSLWRGLLIEYLPLTNKTESFAAAALCVASGTRARDLPYEELADHLDLGD